LSIQWPLCLSLPLPPSRNHSHIHTRAGRVFPSRATVDYMKTALTSLTPLAEQLPSFTGRLVIEAHYFFVNRQRRDTDNIHKLLGDALAKGLATDDSWFLWRDMTVNYDKANPRVELRIYPQTLEYELWRRE